MKRVGNLFDKVFSIENLHEAYKDARKSKRNKKAVLEFERHLGYNINKLHTDITNDTYKPKPYTTFTVTEPKERVIHAPHFSDVVVQHAIYRYIYDIYNKTFIDTSFACRKGYGTHAASDYVQDSMRKYRGDMYFLQLDIKKFFYSIKRSILKKLLEKKIKDKRLIKVMMMFTEYGSPTGIPIGNLLSQIYALIYLNPLDHYIKRELKSKNYVRYVDDFALIGLNRDKCTLLRDKIIRFLKSILNLKLSRHTIQKIRRGINFCGYRTWRSIRVIRKYSLYKFTRRVKSRNMDAVISLLGHAKKTHSMKYMINIVKEISISMYNLLPKSLLPNTPITT